MKFSNLNHCGSTQKIANWNSHMIIIFFVIIEYDIKERHDVKIRFSTH